MFLFIVIATLCLLLTVAADLVKLLRLQQLLQFAFNSGSNEGLVEDVRSAQAELERVRQSTASSDHYVQTIKVMRAENKLRDAEARLRQANNKKLLKGFSLDIIASHALKAVFSVALFVIVVRNRYTPVIIFDERLNFQPLGGLLSFPTGVHNAISVPMWVFSCNTSFRLFYNIVKGK